VTDGFAMPDPDPRAAFAREFRNTRDKSGKTLRQLQAATYVSDSALSRYLSGQTVPPWKAVQALCQACGTDPEELHEAWHAARAARYSWRRTRQRPQEPEGDAAPLPHDQIAQRLEDIAGQIGAVIAAIYAHTGQPGRPAGDAGLRDGTAVAYLRAAQQAINTVARKDLISRSSPRSSAGRKSSHHRKAEHSGRGAHQPDAAGSSRTAGPDHAGSR
jgi:transcriptional regulator with XRE-family HTH domain